jgi:hypothetical protein
MKYEIKNKRLEEIIYNYIVDLFENNPNGELYYNYYYDDNGNETDIALTFYFGDYGDYEALKWYSEEYFLQDDESCNDCPKVSLDYDLENILTGMFNEYWKPVFKKWLKNKYDLEVKTFF